MNQGAYDDLIEIKSFIEKQKIEEQLKNDSEVIVLYGVTGTGKTSIAHFLSGSEMEKFKENGVGPWKIRVKNQNQGKQIGHDLLSETDCPQIYQGDNLLVLDLPGLLDNRGWQQQVKNGYLTSLCLNKYKRMKFILVVDCNSISERGHLNLQDFLNQIKQTLGYLAYSVLDSIRIIVNKFSLDDYESPQILKEQLIVKYTNLANQVCDKAKLETQKIVQDRAEQNFQNQTQSTIRKKQTKVAVQQVIGNRIPEDIDEHYSLQKQQINDKQFQQLQDNRITSNDATIIFRYILVCNPIFGLERVSNNSNPYSDERRNELFQWVKEINQIEIRKATPTIQDNQGQFLQQHENCFQNFKMNMQIFSKNLQELVDQTIKKQENIQGHFNGVKQLIEFLDIVFQKKSYSEQIKQVRKLIDQMNALYSDIYSLKIENSFQILEFYSIYDYLFETNQIYKNLGLEVFQFEIQQIFKSLQGIKQEIPEKNSYQDHVNEKIYRKLKFSEEYSEDLKKISDETYNYCRESQDTQNKLVQEIKDKFKNKNLITDLRSMLKVTKEEILKYYRIAKQLSLFELLKRDFEIILGLQKKATKYQKFFKNDELINQKQLMKLAQWDYRQMKIYAINSNHYTNQLIKLVQNSAKLSEFIELQIENFFLNEVNLEEQKQQVLIQCHESQKFKFQDVDLSKFDEHCERLEKEQSCTIW
ncbi:hypothetical protein pb186bvf_010144 [Paramecium bursaria]